MTAGTIKSSLQFVAKLLKTQKACNNVNPLQNAFTLNSKEEYSGRMILEFHPQVVPRNIIPNSVKIITVTLDISINEDLSKISNSEVFNTIQNKYNCSILVIGKGADNTDGNCKEYIYSMHFDYDEKVDECDYIHPHFHLSFGGDRMKKHFKEEPEANFGRALLLPSPRIAHPPLDIFLAIDFVLCNFFIKDDCDRIRKNPHYKKAIIQSQDRLWRPYYTSLAGYWCQHKGCNISDMNNVWKNYHPSLVGNK